MNATPVAGYLHEAYAASLAEHGTPTHLPESGAWILKRPIPGAADQDAMGCYPLFACERWEQLPMDLEALSGDVVAISAVPDPLGDYDQDLLKRCFPDVVRPFKEHFITDLRESPADYVSRHHRRYAAKSLRQIHIERCDDAEAVLDEWVKLYSVLVDRHAITGIPAFSRFAFARQLSVPGIAVFRALLGADTVGIVLWYVQGRVAYYHLGAYSEIGYEVRASFGLFWSAIEYFAGAGVQWLNLGSGAGSEGRADGLSRFKQGWSTGTRTAYICGRILDAARYASLASTMGASRTTYFPAYRRGEFASGDRTGGEHHQSRSRRAASLPPPSPMPS